MKKSLIEKIHSSFTYMDGATGTMLQKMGMKPGELTENVNLTRPQDVINLHLGYIKAGSRIINTNTFGANIFKFSHEELEKVITAAVENAREAVRLSGVEEVYIALDVGPTGKLLKPLGTLDFEDAVDCFAETVKIGARLGVDLINIETMTDCYETKAAVIAAKENSNLPVFASNVYDEKGLTMTGSAIESNVALLEGLGVDALGVNCSLGPDVMKNLIPRFFKAASVPVIMKPNAGMPDTVNGETVYNINAEEFASDMAEGAKYGAAILGGCCGTTPEYIEKLIEKTKNIEFPEITNKNFSVVSSRGKTVCFGGRTKLIGERINPTGKKLMKQALKENNTEYMLDLAFSQQESGADILDINVGLPGIDEGKMLVEVEKKVQSVIDLPLQIDTSDISALESAARVYNGKPMINSVSGKQAVMDSVFPIAKKYGGVIVGLLLDDNGIPETAEKRVEVAENIIKEAEKYGIDKKNLIFDPLTMTVSTGAENGQITLDAVKMLTERGYNTVLGVSNVSFGLPSRPKINSAFFILAMHNGLSAAIMNPKSDDMMSAFYTFNALKGYDKNFEKYIEFSSSQSENSDFSKPAGESRIQKDDTQILKESVLKGNGDAAVSAVKRLLDNKEPNDIINNILIPALGEVGDLFEKNRIFLPGLMSSAEASSKAFDVIKDFISSKNTQTEKKGAVVLATVKGDIHDIGKNIVKTVMENFGYEIIDLGKDVPKEDILDAVVKSGAKLCGLSALMTTTVPAMEETIKLLHEKTDCLVMAGGAVMTAESAKLIGADFYASDAMEGVRIAQKVYS